MPDLMIAGPAGARRRYNDAGQPVAVVLPDRTGHRARAGPELPNVITAEYRFDKRGQLVCTTYHHDDLPLGNLACAYDRPTT